MTRYIYARTSTVDQNVQQQADLLSSNYPDAVVKMEKASATNMDRPVLSELLSTIVRYDSLVIYDLSRLNRNTTDFLTLIKQFEEDGINLIVHNMGGSPVDTGTPVGKMILTVLVAAEQMNVELMKEKQAIGIATAQKNGKYKGKQQSAKTVTKCKAALIDIENGLSKEKAAKANGIGIATLYRFIKGVSST
ncbi:MAG: recombinase family protein [Alteromonadaceae bacterium]|nr:recombinase family protein [Alteromonadaceae bacterium]